MTDPPCGAASEQVRAHLQRVLASPEFDASGRNRRFLAHVVEEALAGRSARIKAYIIATEVFGRGMDFDPQADPIVRIEAGRLRRSLERYYLRSCPLAWCRSAVSISGGVPGQAATPGSLGG